MAELMFVVSPRLDAKSKAAWKDPRVTGWIAAHASSREMSAEEVARFSGSAHVVVFSGGVVVDHDLNLRARAFVAWAAALLQGLSPEDVNLTDAASRQRVGELTGSGDYTNALIELTTWWHQTGVSLRPRSLGVAFRQLADRYPPALDEFRRLRDEIDLKAPDPELLSDWVTLNEWLRDQAAILRWFDEQPKAGLGTLAWEFWTEREVVKLLASRDRWADAGAALSFR
ncbi:hypothetical protein BH11MYX2_BH11MYX2_39130 [soil metagenome]